MKAEVQFFLNAPNLFEIIELLWDHIDDNNNDEAPKQSNKFYAQWKHHYHLIWRIFKYIAVFIFFAPKWAGAVLFSAVLASDLVWL